MDKTKMLLAVVFVIATVAAFPSELFAQLPNYASGNNLESELQTKGKAITDIVSLVVAMIAILGIIVGGGKLASGNPEGGKQWIIGGIAGLIISGVAYGIASLVAS